MTFKEWIYSVCLWIFINTQAVSTTHHDENNIETSRSHANIGTTGIIIISVIGGLLVIFVGIYTAYKCKAFKRCTKKVRPNPAHTVEAHRGPNRRIVLSGHHPPPGRPMPPPYSIDTNAPPPYFNPVGPTGPPSQPPPPPAYTYVQPNMPMYAPPQYMQ